MIDRVDLVLAHQVLRFGDARVTFLVGDRDRRRQSCVVNAESDQGCPGVAEWRRHRRCRRKKTYCPEASRRQRRRRASGNLFCQCTWAEIVIEGCQPRQRCSITAINLLVILAASPQHIAEASGFPDRRFYFERLRLLRRGGASPHSRNKITGQA